LIVKRSIQRAPPFTVRNPLNRRRWLRASTGDCEAYTNWPMEGQISFNHAGFR
jgi:hypothetical protein